MLGGSLAVSLATLFLVWHAQDLVASRPDPYGFSAMGRHVAEGHGFSGYGEVLSRKGPLYPLFIGAIYAAFGEREIFVQLAQCLLFAGTAFLAYDTGRRVFNERTGLLAGTICALNPSLLRYVPDFHLEELLVFLVTLTAWCSARFVAAPTARNGLFLGLAGGLAALTKPTVLLYPPLLLAVFALTTHRSWGHERRARMLAVAAAFAGMGAAILPWTIRNYHSTGGKLVLITTGASDAFLRGYVFSKPEYATLSKPPYTDAENEANAMFRAICEANGTVWGDGGLNDIALDKLLNVEAKKRFFASPARFARKFVIGLFTFWYEMTSLKTSLVAGALALVGWMLALIGIGRARREHKPAWILWVPILSVNIMLAALLALGRYSVPVVPCLWILAAYGLDTLILRYLPSSRLA